MHKLCFFLVLTFMSCLGYAKPISEKEAIQVAKDFLYQKTSLNTKAFYTAAIVPQFSMAYVCHNENKISTRLPDSQEACYYVINVNDNDGYVIVAGDDRARQVLAYSYEGNFNPNNLPANCVTWLRGYQEEISYLLNEPEDNNVETASLYRSITYPSVVVEPMTSTKWGQGTPYNLQCPIDILGGKNELSAVGCTATATAQIMYYHQWPGRPFGSIMYTDNTQKVNRTMNFDERPAFDWKNMLEVYPFNGDVTETEENAVANLMVCVGHAAKMSYSATESGATIKNAALGLRDYFNYDENIHCYESKYTPTNEWIDILMNDLTAGRPVLYSGYNERAGHAFVCDGYDGNGLFHFNWGWGGSSDGYYALTSLYPGYQGIGGSEGSYTFMQSIITNIQPLATDSKPQNDMLVIRALYSVDKDNNFYTDGVLEVNKGDKFGIGLYYNNVGLTGFSGKMCIGIIQDNQIVPLASEQVISLISGAADKWFVSWPDISKLPVGEYSVFTFYKSDDDTEWNTLIGDQAQAKSFLMTIGENMIKLEKQTPRLSLKLSKEFDPGKIYNSGTKVWYINLVNDGDVRLEGKVGVHLKKAETGESVNDFLFSTLGYCDPGEETIVRVSGDLSNIELGDYIITPYYCSTNSIYTSVTLGNIIPLCEGIQLAVERRPLINIVTKEEGYILDKKDNSVEIQVSQPSSKIPWNGRIYGKIFKKTGSGEDEREDTNIIVYSENLVINKPSVITTKLSTESVDLPVGDDYEIVFYLDDGNEEARGSGSLSIVNTATSIREEHIPDLNISFEKAQSKLYIVAGIPLSKVTIVSLSGSIIQMHPLDGVNRTELLLNGLTAGIYFVQLEAGDQSSVRKIVIP